MISSQTHIEIISEVLRKEQYHLAEKTKRVMSRPAISQMDSRVAT